MSSPPSTVENIRSTAAKATHTVAETIDPSGEEKTSTCHQDESLKDTQRSHLNGVSYKEQLDNAAIDERKIPENEKGIVAKMLSSIPGASTIQSAVLGKQEGAASEEKVNDITEPPIRPQNDAQVEEFLRGQYRSKGKNGNN